MSRESLRLRPSAFAPLSRCLLRDQRLFKAPQVPALRLPSPAGETPSHQHSPPVAPELVQNQGGEHHQSSGSCCLPYVDEWTEQGAKGGQDGPRVEVTGGWWWCWWAGGSGGFVVTTNLLPFTDTKEKGERKGEEEEEEARESDTTPAILFLSSAATAFVAMTTQADDLIAVASECPCS